MVDVGELQIVHIANIFYRQVSGAFIIFRNGFEKPQRAQRTQRKQQLSVLSVSSVVNLLYHNPKVHLEEIKKSQRRRGISKMYTVIREKFERIVAENGLLDETVVIRAKPLTPEEAIGNPESEDFPILKGAERMMQAEFAGSFGQAFTDMYGDFEGTLQDVLAMEH